MADSATPAPGLTKKMPRDRPDMRRKKDDEQPVTRQHNDWETPISRAECFKQAWAQKERYDAAPANAPPPTAGAPMRQQTLFGK